MTHFSNHRINLVTGQLAAFAGLGTLRHLDLHHVRIDKIFRRHTEATRSHLLNGRTHGVAIRHWLIAIRLFAAFARIRLAADAVHRNGERRMGFARYRAVGHCARCEALYDRGCALYLVERNSLAAIVFSALDVEEAAFPGHNPKLDPSLLRQQQLGDNLQQLTASADPQINQPVGSNFAVINTGNLHNQDKESQVKVQEEIAEEVRVPGRDLKQEPETEVELEPEEENERGPREKRDLTPVLCENDPLCAAKFDRNPLADSGLLDRGDPGRFLSVGGGLRRRSLLALAEPSEDELSVGPSNGTTGVRTSLGPGVGRE